MLFLIVTMMISALCVVFDCYAVDFACSVLFLIVTMMISALCLVFDCYDDGYHALCCF